jgi:NDP-sugar pyrophosphorylase family protein
VSGRARAIETAASRRRPGGTKAIILAGGRGTRLAPFTSVLPKPLMPIGDRSILEIVVAQLSRCGITDIVLSVGYLSHLIQAVFDNHEHRWEGAPAGVQPTISYVHENTPLGTAGPLRLVAGLDDTFLVMNGDLLTDLDYGELVHRHRESGSLLTVATQQRVTRMDYGVLHLNGTRGAVRRVTGYEEKPEVVAHVSMGVYVLEPRTLDYLPDHGPFDFPDLVHALLEDGQKVGAYSYDGLWFDIGRHEDYERAAIAWENSSQRFLGSRAAHSSARQA